MNSGPLVSIIVPSFNQGAFIRETIESCLSQDYRPIEVIVVDGASTDGTISVLHDYDDTPEVQWTSEPDRGVVEAVNKGFARAQGEIGAIQSSDDSYLPDAVSQAVPILESDPNLGFVFGDIIKIDVAGHALDRTNLDRFSREHVLSAQTWIPQPACFFRLNLVRELGGWREEVPYAADTDLWFRMMLLKDARKIDAVMARRRVHGQQRDQQGGCIIRDYSRMIRDLFDLHGAPPEYRPAAEAGLLLLMNRYSQGESEETKLARRADAARLYPPLARSLADPAQASFPGRLRAWCARVLGNDR